MKCKVKRITSISLSILIIASFFSFSPANASSSKLLDEFENSVVVKDGDVIKGENLKNGDYRVYKIDLSTGYQLRVFGKGSGKKGISSDFRISLYDRDGNMLSSMKDLADGEKIVEAYYYKGYVSLGTSFQKNEKETVFIVLECAVGTYQSVIEDYDFQVATIDRTDIDLLKDAGDSVDNALVVDLENPKGAFPNNFLGYNKCGKSKFCSNDEQDFFKFNLNTGEKIKITIKPSSSLGIEGYLQDANGINLKSFDKLDNSNSITTEYESVSNSPVYVKLVGNGFGSYSLEYQKLKDQDAVDSDNSGEKDDAVFGAILKAGKSWFQKYWIYILIIIILIVAVFTGLFFTRKFKKRTVRGVILSEMIKQRAKGQGIASVEEKPSPVKQMEPKKENSAVVADEVREKDATTQNNDQGIEKTSLGERKPIEYKNQ